MACLCITPNSFTMRSISLTRGSAEPLACRASPTSSKRLSSDTVPPGKTLQPTIDSLESPLHLLNDEHVGTRPGKSCEFHKLNSDTEAYQFMHCRLQYTSLGPIIDRTAARLFLVCSPDNSSFACSMMLQNTRLPLI